MSIKVCASMDEVPAGYFLADCAVSGGTLRDYLLEALRAAQGRLCVRLHPVYMDFALPCPSGAGTELTAEELRQCYHGAPCHFSQRLCAEYFTYLREDTAHVVLFDSLDSLRSKYQLLLETGVPMVLIEDGGLRQALCD